MKQPSLAIWRNPCKTGLLLFLSCWAGFTAARARSFEPELPPATNVLELSHLISPNANRICAFDLQGTVLAANSNSGVLFFQDHSGAVVLNADLSGTKLRAGQTIRLSGTDYVAYTDVGLSLGATPVVNNDGLHSDREIQSTLFLKTGEHPIQVRYFNRTYTAQLNVSYSGPNMMKQLIPNDALRQIEPASGREHQGLRYRCFEGEWTRLPNYDRLTPVKAGIVPNFDIGVRSRQEYVGLDFKGLLKIPRDGNYTFYLTSDDGSQLFLDFLPPKIAVLGTGPLPPPTEVTPGQPLPDGQSPLWAEVNGTVTFLHKNEQGIEIELASDGNEMRVELLNATQDVPSYLLHCRLRVRGICPKVRNIHGQTCAGLIVGDGWQSVSILNVPQENWAAVKPQTLNDLTNAVASGHSNGIVRLHGKIHIAPTTHAVHFEDGTGCCPIEYLGINRFATGTTVDCLSRWSWNGTNLFLQGAIGRIPSDASDTNRNDVPVLTTALQVQQLKPDEARRKYPVELHGVITWTSLGNDSPSLVIQDVTRAVYVTLDVSRPIPDVHVGDFCKIDGFTLPGEFSPIVQLQNMIILSRGQMPRPVTPTREQLLNGSLDAQYVELRGMLTSVHDSYVTLLTSEGSFDINIAPGPEETWSKLVDAIIRVRGCFFADWNKQTRRVIVEHPIYRIWAAKTSIDSMPPADLFQVDKVPGTELMRFDAKFDPFQWVKISGQIIHRGSDVYYMMDGVTGLRFQLAHAQDFAPGDEVEVVGLVELGGASPLLRQAVARKTGQASLPKPQPLSLDSANGQFDSTLVSLDGTLVDMKDRGTETVLEMQIGVKSFIARLPSKRRPGQPWQIGSRLKLTGVFHALDESRATNGGVSSFELLLNSPADVQVLARPPWWTLGRLLTMAAVLVFGLALAGVWIALLRRQVERRTLQLRHEIGQREAAEKMRAVEQERSRIARDLHDDLGSELTEISMLASLRPGIKTQPTTAMERLQGIAEKSRSMISALDGVVWVVNSKNDTLSSLVEYLASNAEEFLAKTGVGCRVEMPAIRVERKIPAEVRHDVLLAVREAFNNAVRHGHPEKVLLRFAISGDSLEILIQDDGCGFDVLKVSPGNGIANLHDRMRKVGGACRIESAPGKGTTITLKLPLPT